MLFRSLVSALAAFGLWAGQADAAAPGYPERPVRFIVTYPPGGPTDFVARTISRIAVLSCAVRCASEWSATSLR